LVFPASRDNQDSRDREVRIAASPADHPIARMACPRPILSYRSGIVDQLDANKVALGVQTAPQSVAPGNSLGDALPQVKLSARGGSLAAAASAAYFSGCLIN
jgi:hypothetical protein